MGFHFVKPFLKVLTALLFCNAPIPTHDANDADIVNDEFIVAAIVVARRVMMLLFGSRASRLIGFDAGVKSCVRIRTRSKTWLCINRPNCLMSSAS